MGPPCETWSAVRFNPLSDDKHGPRPIRSLEEPWGITTTTRREKEQLTIGNALLRAALIFAAACSVAEASMLLEHPAISPIHPQAPSIWKLPIMHQLMALPNVTQVTFDQCSFGAVSPKPTTFLLVCLSRLKRDILDMPNRGRCPHPCGYSAHASSKGKKADGTYHTTQLKEYPPALNNKMAQALASTYPLLTQPLGPEAPMQEIPDAFLPMLAPLDYDMEQREIGQDYSALNQRSSKHERITKIRMPALAQ